jgi:hypothetical protein
MHHDRAYVAISHDGLAASLPNRNLDIAIHLGPALDF